MPRYFVKIIKPVTDYLTGEITVEAPDEEAALRAAYINVENDRVTFEYWMESPNGCMEEITYEATEVDAEGNRVGPVDQVDCPVDDPDCLGGAGDCHDACERPEVIVGRDPGDEDAGC